MDIAILRKAPADSIRTITLFGGDVTLRVLVCGPDEMKQIRDLAADLQRQGFTSEDAFNCAYGRVALIGWDGLTDSCSPLAPCNENRDLLMTGSAEIRTAVITAAASLKAGIEKN
jgi:hypothetical protein